MPGENIYSWSKVAADNGTADSLINWTEGQARASVNDSARSMLAAHAKNRDLLNGSITTGGTANAQTFTSGVGFVTPAPTGLRTLLKNGFTNTGAMTLNMDGIGDVPIKDVLGADVIAGAVVANGYSEYLYDGTNWILLQDKSGQVLLSSQTASGTDIVFTSGIDGTYDEYVVVFSGVTSTHDGDEMWCQVSTDAGVTWRSTPGDYRRMITVVGDDGSTGVGASTSDPHNVIAGNASVLGTIGGELHWYGPALATYKPFIWSVGWFDGTHFKYANGCCHTAFSAATNGMRFFFSAGSPATGQFAMYGVKK